MITLLRTDSGNEDFIELVTHLDADLAERDGDQHVFYAQLNKIEGIKHAVVAFDNNIAVGCGAIKEYAPATMQVKRMYVSPGHRGKGIASAVLAELEKWAAEMNYKDCILETGKNQPEAIELYKKNLYQVIPNYGQYIGVENSICFKKQLI